MPRAKGGTGADSPLERTAHAEAARTGDGTDDAGRDALVRFLRALADRVERDPNLAAALATLLRQSGLLAANAAPNHPAAGEADAALPRLAAGRAAHDAPTPALDPFATLRERDEAGLRALLGDLELVELRHIVRLYRLDPARLSARWTVRERVIELIVEQVRARANLGRAFERV